MTVPTIEQHGDSLGSSGGTVQATTAADSGSASAGVDGPSITFLRSDGSEIVLDVQDLQVYLAAIQTLLLLYVTYKEVSG